MLEVSSVSKAFFPNTVNEKVALRGIDLTLDKGDFVTVIGSNGAGKSTLLNIIAGRYRPDSGSATIGWRAMSAGSSRTPWPARPPT